MPEKKLSPVFTRTKRVTLQDIADLAGVQKMVVSNALNGTRSVAPATRERVQQIARELNYVPNFAARALTTGKTGIIAILSGALNQPYYASMVHFLETSISADQYSLMLVRKPDEVKDIVHSAGKIAFDGAIAIDMLGLVGEFRFKSSIPCVSIATIPQPFVDNIVVDLGAGVTQALEIMMSRGRKRIAYLATADNMQSEIEVRSRIYHCTMRDNGRTPEVINVETDDSDILEVRFKKYILKNGCPDALLCQNDETAMGAFRVLRELGFQVPGDILLVGCDGQIHMKDFQPPLSTIVQPMEEMCAMAWQFLQRRIAQPDLPHQEAIFQGELVIRESLGAL